MTDLDITDDMSPEEMYDGLERIEELESVLKDKPLGDPEYTEHKELCDQLGLITSDELRGYHDFLRSRTEDALRSGGDRFREEILARLDEICSPSAYESIERMFSEWYTKRSSTAISDRVRNKFKELEDKLGYVRGEQKILSLDDLRQYHARAKEQIQRVLQGLGEYEFKETVLEDLKVNLCDLPSNVCDLVLSTVRDVLDRIKLSRINFDSLLQENPQEL